MAVEWYPQRLSAAIAEAFRASLAEVAADAKATSPSSKAGAEVVQTGSTSAALRPTGLGPIFEEGARPHEIDPHHGLLYLSNLGAFVSGPVHHPGSPPKPYIHPAAARWAAGGFQTVARGSLASQGF